MDLSPRPGSGLRKRRTAPVGQPRSSSSVYALNLTRAARNSALMNLAVLCWQPADAITTAITSSGSAATASQSIGSSAPPDHRVARSMNALMDLGLLVCWERKSETSSEITEQRKVPLW